VNAKILGVVINRAHIQRGHYGYYHYRYNDYYGKTDAGKELPSSSPSWEDEDRNPRAESTTM